MPDTATLKTVYSNKIIWCFLLFWTILNTTQAFTLELQADEAYYWLYSRYLDWGYFDHPPMVALFIRIGDSIMHTELGLRLLTVLTSSASIYVLWLILKKYAVDAVAFVLVISGVFIFHIYGFTTTPDGPLFFFTVLFYFVYQRYITENKWSQALILGVIVACLLYSKYNAILVIGFTLLANPGLLKRGTFWAIAAIAVALYTPHILWQVNHGYPSINYHLFERSARTYDFNYTFSYLPGQLLMAGPLIGWFLFYKAFSTKISDAFIRCLVVNCFGTLIFFFFSSAKGDVQPQWTFILFAPLVMLVLIGFQQKGSWPKWLVPVAAVNLMIILVVRVIIIIGFGFAKTYGHLKSYYGFKDWAYEVKKHAGDSYVVMIEGFQNPSKYDYYTNSLKCFAYDTRYYRRTQFDIWPMEDSLQHKRVYYLSYYPIKNVTTDAIKVAAGTWYGGWVNDTRTYQKVLFETPTDKITAAPGQKVVFNLKVSNPYNFPISFSDTGYTHKVFLEACFFDGDKIINTQKAGDDFNKITLKPHQSTTYTFTFMAPLQKGNLICFFLFGRILFREVKTAKLLTLRLNKIPYL